MLEILVVIALSRKLASMARDRGMPGWPFVVLLILLWIVAQVAGFIAGVAYFGPPAGDEFPFGPYLCGLAASALSSSVSFIIVALFPVVPKPDDEFDRPRRRRRIEDDDEDDDEFDRPRRSSPDRTARGDADDTRFRDRPD